MKQNNFITRSVAVLFLAITFSNVLLGQIDMSDTTAIVMAHWQLGEEQKFRASSFINTMENDNSISRQEVTYDLTIKVIDSTSAGYVLEWKRNNFQIGLSDELDSVLLKITEGIPLLILTDEFGSSVSSLNWEDAGEEIKSRAEVIRERHSDHPEISKKLNRLIRQSNNKEGFETNMLLDVHQYLAFHGAKYKFDERIDMKVKVPNNYGGDPLDANATLMLDQVNMPQGTVIIRSSQRVNPYQLTAVTYDYLKTLNMEGAELPAKEDFPMITKLEWGGSEIHVNSGWVIYSVQTKQTTNDKLVTVEEMTMEIIREEEK